MKLVTPEGMDTRPTQDIIKETLFNMIQFEVPGSVFVDLCAGPHVASTGKVKNVKIMSIAGLLYRKRQKGHRLHPEEHPHHQVRGGGRDPQAGRPECPPPHS